MSTEPIAIRLVHPARTAALLLCTVGPLAAFPPAAAASPGPSNGPPPPPNTSTTSSQEAPGDTTEPETALARRWLQAHAEQAQRQAENDQRNRGTNPQASPSQGPHPRTSPSASRASGQRPSERSSSRPHTPRSIQTARPAAAPQAPAPEQNREAPRPASASDAEATPQPPPKKQTRHYEIQEGDTLSSLARRFYSNTKHWKKIAEANPEIDPARLQVGQKVRLPGLKRPASNDTRQSAEPSTETAPSPAEANAPPTANRQNAEAADPANRNETSARTVQVKTGDTLSSIAERAYGDSGLWKRLLEANRDRIEKPQSLQVGVELRLPDRPE